ncbi:putative hydrolase [Mycena kentingensis (nom. inval.)]|nr:putative hydrolase [Mycena kentingensis (nom. inval.)]
MPPRELHPSLDRRNIEQLNLCMRIEPLFYENLSVDNSTRFRFFLAVHKHKSDAFLAQAVRHVVINIHFAGSIAEIGAALVRCTGVTRLTGLGALMSSTLPSFIKGMRPSLCSSRTSFRTASTLRWRASRVQTLTHIDLFDSVYEHHDARRYVDALLTLPRCIELPAARSHGFWDAARSEVYLKQRAGAGDPSASVASIDDDSSDELGGMGNLEFESEDEAAPVSTKRNLKKREREEEKRDELQLESPLENPFARGWDGEEGEGGEADGEEGVDGMEEEARGEWDADADAEDMPLVYDPEVHTPSVQQDDAPPQKDSPGLEASANQSQSGANDLLREEALLSYDPEEQEHAPRAQEAEADGHTMEEVHAKETNLPPPEFPVLCVKPVTALTGPNAPVTIPRAAQPVEQQLPDYEVNFVAGKGCVGGCVRFGWLAYSITSRSHCCEGVNDAAADGSSWTAIVDIHL